MVWQSNYLTKDSRYMIYVNLDYFDGIDSVDNGIA